MSTNWESFFGSELQTKKGVDKTNEVLVNKKIVGIYFSAHWCPPCRGFTPILSKMYTDLMEKYHDDIEIVFVSADQDLEAFTEYYESMSFTALPFSSKDENDALSDKYEVSGIPSLIFVDENGNIITKEGRKIVMECQDNVEEFMKQLLKNN